MENSRTQKMMDQVTSMVMDEAKEFITSMVPVIEDDSAKKIPENVFREIFLPYFVGDAKGTHEQDYLSHWIGVVGSASLPADVVDIRGETLFRVPPLVDTSVLNTETKPVKYTGMLAELVDQSRVHPGLAYPEFFQKSGKALDALLENNAIPNYDQWRKIYEFYGLVKSPEAVAQSNASKPDAEDFFE